MMKYKYTFAAFAALAVLPACADFYWLAVGIPTAATGYVDDGLGNYLVLRNTDPSVEFDEITLWDIRRETTGLNRLYRHDLKRSKEFYDGCPVGSVDVDLTLPIKDAEGNDYTFVKINSQGFQDNLYLRSIKLPDSLESIGTAAFKNAKNLQTFLFPVNPANLQSIGDSIFMDCKSLECLEWPATSTTMKSYMCNNTGIVGVSLPAVTNIGANAFSSTPNLRSVEFGGAADQTIVFKSQSFQGQGTTIKTLLFHEATPDLADGFVNGGNNFLDHVGFNGLLICLPMNADKNGPTSAWSEWVENYLSAFPGSSFTFPAKNADGTWTDGSWYHNANYPPARKTYVVRFWDPDSPATSALLAY